MLSICKISLRKIYAKSRDEGGRILFLHNEFLFIYLYKWHKETGHFLTKISNFVQFSNKKHFLQF